jgi:hypothetical protein
VKRAGVIVLLVLATLFWTVGLVAVWAQRQALDTQNWVETSDRLLENEDVRNAVSTAILQRLYASAPLETRLREELPEQLKPLAGPVAASLREVANRRAPEILGTAAALTAWERANRAAHKTLLKVLNGDAVSGGKVTLNLHDLIAQVAAGAGLPPDIADRLPASAQQLQVLKADKLKAAQDGLETLKKLTVLIVILAVAFMAGAIALSSDRRRTVIACGGCVIFAGVAVLAVRRLGGEVTVDQLAVGANAKPAVRATFVIGTSLLSDAALGSIVFGLFVVTGAWLMGGGKRATALRDFSAPALRTHAAAVRLGLGFLLLLLIIWGPVPWTRSLWPMLIFAVAAYVWLEGLRRVAA